VNHRSDTGICIAGRPTNTESGEGKTMMPKSLQTPSLLATTLLFALGCTAETGSTSDAVAALYGERSRSGDCAMTEEAARAEAQARFPSSTILEVERADVYGIATWEVELETENGGEAEVELFVASCGLYEIESDDPDVAFVNGERFPTPLADAIAAARAELDGAFVEWELERDADHDGAWVYELTFGEDDEVTVSVDTGAVLEVDLDEGEGDDGTP
jgi:uncharacterized membrane protein YkoI